MLPELLSPAGGFDAALAAFQYGADAVYLGLPRFSARAEADNLTPDRLRALLAYARSFSPAKKIYVTFNTLVQDAELPLALDMLDALDDLAPDGVIVQDLGIARLIRNHFPRLSLHASTQLAAHSLDGVLALKALGFSRVVLARELTFDEIRHIVKACGVEIEIFVHGALCYSMSGLCLFSSHIAGRSGNRGRCAYCCRNAFTTASQGRSYPFSMKDLALAPILDAVTATHAHALKIEGRMKSPLYVACVTDYYRKKLDGALTPEADFALTQDLQTIFSRPWTRLYAEGPDADAESIIDPVAIGHRGAPIGRADAVIRDRDNIRWLRFTTNRALEKHDGLQAELPGGGKPFGCAVNLLRAAGTHKPLIALPAGSVVEVALPDGDVPIIPRNAPLFCSASQAVRRRYEIQSLRESALPMGHPINLEVALAPDGITVRAAATFASPDDISANTFIPLALSPSRQTGQTGSAVRKAFERLGDTAWQLGSLTLADPFALYAPPSKLNEARRAVLAELTAAWQKCRADRLAVISAAWCTAPGPLAPMSRPTAQSASWSLKLRAEAPLLSVNELKGIDTLILAIGHTPSDVLEKHLAAWRSFAGECRIRLALPLLTRAPEVSRLKATLRTLVQSGWTDWECAALAGYHMLNELGLKPASADWSLYALNRVAADELARLGTTMQVLSPEITLDTLRELCAASHNRPAPVPELIVYQHTPLFISETAPCLPRLSSLPEAQGSVATVGPPIVLTDLRKRTFITRIIDHRWITVLEAPYCLANHLSAARAAGVNRFRIDLSWSPESANIYNNIQPVRKGEAPAGTHAAWFEHSLV